MKKVTGIIGTATLALMLGACGGADDGQSTQGSIDDGEQTTGNGSIDHGVEDKSEIEGQKQEQDEDDGYSINGVPIEEAVDVPEEEREAILETFNQYIETLNEGDVDAYVATLSEESYDLDEERTAAEEMLANEQAKRTPDDITIVKYTEDEAQVFATLTIEFKQKGEDVAASGRQVTVLTKQDGDWKVSAVNAMPDPVLEEEK